MEDLIWDYLDGNAQAQDRSLIEERLEADDAFNKEFRRHKLVHNALRLMPVDKAPARLIEKTMIRLIGERGYDISKTPLLVFMGIVLLAGLLGVLLPAGESTYLGYIADLLSYDAGGNCAFDGLSPIMSYLWLLLVFPTFYLLDQFIARKLRSQHSS